MGSNPRVTIYWCYKTGQVLSLSLNAHLSNEDLNTFVFNAHLSNEDLNTYFEKFREEVKSIWKSPGANQVPDQILLTIWLFLALWYTFSQTGKMVNWPSVSTASALILPALPRFIPPHFVWRGQCPCSATQIWPPNMNSSQSFCLNESLWLSLPGLLISKPNL